MAYLRPMLVEWWSVESQGVCRFHSRYKMRVPNQHWLKDGCAVVGEQESPIRNLSHSGLEFLSALENTLLDTRMKPPARLQGRIAEGRI